MVKCLRAHRVERSGDSELEIVQFNGLDRFSNSLLAPCSCV